MILLHKVAHMFFEKLFFHYISSVGIFCRLTKFSSYVMSFSNWILLWSRNMRDRPVVVVMDGWHLREKSKVFLKFFFLVWYNVAWKMSSLIFKIYAKFKRSMNYRAFDKWTLIKAFMWHQNMLKYLSADIICSNKQTVSQMEALLGKLSFTLQGVNWNMFSSLLNECKYISAFCLLSELVQTDLLITRKPLT